VFPHIINHRLNAQYKKEVKKYSDLFLVNANGDVFIADCECYQADWAISTGQLNILLCLHLLPINVVVSYDPNREVLF
jgi:hypothetical protein